MKTTIDIADELLERARRQARRERKTLKQIIEESLRRQLEEPPEKASFSYRPHTFTGKGLQSGVAEGGWEHLRDTIYRLG